MKFTPPSPRIENMQYLLSPPVMPPQPKKKRSQWPSMGRLAGTGLVGLGGLGIADQALNKGRGTDAVINWLKAQMAHKPEAPPVAANPNTEFTIPKDSPYAPVKPLSPPGRGIPWDEQTPGGQQLTRDNLAADTHAGMSINPDGSHQVYDGPAYRKMLYNDIPGLSGGYLNTIKNNYAGQAFPAQPGAYDIKDAKGNVITTANKSFINQYLNLPIDPATGVGQYTGSAQGLNNTMAKGWATDVFLPALSPVVTVGLALTGGGIGNNPLVTEGLDEQGLANAQSIGATTGGTAGAWSAAKSYEQFRNMLADSKATKALIKRAPTTAVKRSLQAARMTRLPGAVGKVFAPTMAASVFLEGKDKLDDAAIRLADNTGTSAQLGSFGNILLKTYKDAARTQNPVSIDALDRLVRRVDLEKQLSYNLPSNLKDISTGTASQPPASYNIGGVRMDPETGGLFGTKMLSMPSLFKPKANPNDLTYPAVQSLLTKAREWLKLWQAQQAQQRTT